MRCLGNLFLSKSLSFHECTRSNDRLPRISPPSHPIPLRFLRLCLLHSSLRLMRIPWCSQRLLRFPNNRDLHRMSLGQPTLPCSVQNRPRAGPHSIDFTGGSSTDECAFIRICAPHQSVNQVNRNLYFNHNRFCVVIQAPNR